MLGRACCWKGLKCNGMAPITVRLERYGEEGLVVVDDNDVDEDDDVVCFVLLWLFGLLLLL